MAGSRGADFLDTVRLGRCAPGAQHCSSVFAAALVPNSTSGDCRQQSSSIVALAVGQPVSIISAKTAIKFRIAAAGSLPGEPGVQLSKILMASVRVFWA